MVGSTLATAAALILVVAGADPLTCWSCSSKSHGSSCRNLDPENVTFAANATRNCSIGQTYCTVKRIWHVVEEGGEELDLSFNRSCTSYCDPYCNVIGDRTKIHSCTSCCTESLCNTGNSASSRHSGSTLLLLAASLAAITATLTSNLMPTVTPVTVPTLSFTPTLVDGGFVSRPGGFVSRPVAQGRLGYQVVGSIPSILTACSRRSN
ncbi:uncharacterized protein [Panulirus ornatus]